MKTKLNFALFVGLLTLIPLSFAQNKGAGKPTPQGQAFKELLSSGSCSGKRHCVVVYVTPWCPTCHSKEPMFKEWQSKLENDPGLGMKIVVGLERNQGDNKRYAEQYGSQAVIDQNSDIQKAINDPAYPNIYLMDGGELNSFAGGAENWVKNYIAQKK
jgi:thiol-disulfide isomerase/thioredoxin